MPSTSQKVIASLATPVAVVVAGAMVYQASYAAFSGQTRNSGNEWSTGIVKLTDDDNGQARFRVADMKPGDTGVACIKITANASVPSTVKGYTVNPVTSSVGLERRVMLKVEGGTGGTATSCTGFTPEAGADVVPEASLETLSSSYNWDTAMGGWKIGAGTFEKTYRFTWRFDTTGMTQAQIDQLQNAKVGIDLQWEMRSDS